jgi:glutathione synthase/RimK-type ligase-like ATP-grasp enzyme
VDYRYAEDETLRAVTVDEEFANRCVALAATFGVEFAGIDFRVMDNGDAYCLELNPSPAFSYYELRTGQPIARAVAEYLVSGTGS